MRENASAAKKGFANSMFKPPNGGLPLLTDSGGLTVPSRYKAQACIHSETYKYFFAPKSLPSLWKKLVKKYGKIELNEVLKVKSINSAKFLFRAVYAGNPITVIRKRKCTLRD